MFGAAIMSSRGASISHNDVIPVGLLMVAVPLGWQPINCSCNSFHS